jgi:hypothetical protein
MNELTVRMRGTTELQEKGRDAGSLYQIAIPDLKFTT